ncbi:hypothetical protein K2X40_05625 [Candidatus Babeliales bacterium]|nr:hypothetical protein [Candidatus Babeliales bacterium]
MKRLLVILLLLPASLQGAASSSDPEPSINEQHLRIFKNIMFGGVGGGVVSATIEQPWLHWQNRRWCGLEPSRKPLMWYKGSGLNVVSRFPIMSIQYLAYDAYARYLLQEAAPGALLSDSQRVIAAVAGGALSAPAATTTEMLFMYRNNLAMQAAVERRAVSIYNAVNFLIQNHGVKSLGRAFCPVLFRNMLITAAWVPEWGGRITKAYELEGSDYEWTANIAGATAVGIVVAMLTLPFHKARALMQKDIDAKVYPTMASVFKDLYKQGGFRNIFWEGLGLRTGQVVTSVMFVRLYFEALKKLGLYQEESKERL